MLFFRVRGKSRRERDCESGCFSIHAKTNPICTDLLPFSASYTSYWTVDPKPSKSSHRLCVLAVVRYNNNILINVQYQTSNIACTATQTAQDNNNRAFSHDKIILFSFYTQHKIHFNTCLTKKNHLNPTSIFHLNTTMTIHRVLSESMSIHKSYQSWNVFVSLIALNTTNWLCNKQDEKKLVK